MSRHAFARSLALSAIVHATIAAFCERDWKAEAAAGETDEGLKGESFEVEASGLQTAPFEQRAASEARSAEAQGARAEIGAYRDGLKLAGRAAAHAGDSSESGGNAASSAALYGAVGVRYAEAITTAFARIFPQYVRPRDVEHVASGSAADLDVVLQIDAGGHLIAHELRGDANAGVRAAVERTLVAMAHRLFVAARPTTRVRIRAFAKGAGSHHESYGIAFPTSVERGCIVWSNGRELDVRLSIEH